MKVSRQSVVMDRIVKLEAERDEAIARAEAAERVLETVGKFALHRSQLAEWVERRPQLESYEEWRIVYDKTRNVVEDAENEMLAALAAYDAQRTEDDGE